MYRRNILFATFLVFGACSQIGSGGFDLGTAIDSGSDLYEAASLTDEQAQTMALQCAKESDRVNPVSPPNSKYSQRLAKLTAPYKKYDGLNLKFKAYNIRDVNAFALADGNIRVFAGLMDKMTDDELLFIIGHEIGHVKEGHSKEKMRLAHIASATRKGVASSNSVAGVVAASELGGLAEAVINAQFSQSEEEESDDYGLALLKTANKNPKAAASALRKLSDGSSSGGMSFLSSHPEPEDRAERLEEDM